MVAFAVSTLVTVLMIVGVLVYGRRRSPDAPLSWGEAMVAATYVFMLMFLAYGIVPHQWLTWADNELNWRPDRLVVGPGNIVDKLPMDITYVVIRDIIVSGIYVIFLVLHVALWVMWQKRGETKPVQAPTSPYGRPLVKRA